jgi:hypothetical protein
MDSKNAPEKEQHVQIQQKKPLGVFILGGINCFLGTLSLVQSFQTNPEDVTTFLKLLKNNNITIDMTSDQFKGYNIVAFVAAAIILTSGLGLLRRKEWARKMTVYFSFIMAAIIFLTVILQPAFISLVMAQVVYLGVFIVYFTNKKVENYFTGGKA